jgi:hypothetical protein
MMNITVVDKQAPIVDCPDDVELDCTTDLEEYNRLESEDIDDCSPTTVFITDSILFSGDCDGDYISQYLRRYIVVDAYFNADTCEQIISMVQAELDDVEFPPDLTGINALACFPPPDTSPDATGTPSVDGNPIVNGFFCNLSAISQDIVIPICSGSYKIMRTWMVFDWCDNSSSATAIQQIEVLDNTPPVVVAPPDMTVSTGSINCTADVQVPPAMITDDCSDIDQVWMSTPMGTIFSNGGLLEDLPIGVHTIIFMALTDCGLQGADTMMITVVDLQPPVPVCNQGLAIPVNLDGFAIIPAHIFNAASHDNCGPVYFKVRRMDAPVGYECANPGNPNNMFDDFIQFCCEDIPNNNIMVVLRVYDIPPAPGPVADDYLAGHFNDCMVQVEVQDKLPPQIICPSDLTISCEFPFTLENLEVFGSVVFAEGDRELICIDDPGVPGDPGLLCIGLDGLATDNCSVEVTSVANLNINNCGVGTLTRTFTATDEGGLMATCTQTISIINYDLFDESQIIWPLDLTTSDICEIGLLDPEDLDPPYDMPVLLDGPCDLVGATYEDDVFDFTNNDQACFKILRTWTVIDWCQINSGYGLWTHLQVIKVMNTVAPVILPIEDVSECSFDPDCQGLELDFFAEAEDDCSGENSLTWRYFIDLDNDQSFDFISSPIIGGSVAFSFDIPIGSHRILYTVSDQCGNQSTAEQLVEVESCKPPSAKCIHGLSTSLMPMDTDGDGTVDWGMVVMQAEMFDAGSDHPCGNPITLAFSADPSDVSQVFDCNDLGENEIELWAIDDNGLTDFCITTLDVQDNTGICPPGLGGNTGTISGNISVPQSGKLGGAMIYLDGSQQPGIPSNADGYFVFPSMSFGGNYTVRPVKDGDDRNGVTTIDLVKIQKHLLGLETLPTPFDYIAADVNNSTNITAIDILQLRRLILGIDQELHHNTSWRFIDQAHLFPDPYNPWSSPWPETYQIQPFMTSMNEVNFHAVKIGDLNRSAQLHLGGQIIQPRNGNACQITYQAETIEEADVIRVDILLDDADIYSAIQFSFDWDYHSYQLMDWIPGEFFSTDDYRLPDQRSQQISMAGFTTTGWPAGQIRLMSLWLKPLTTIAPPLRMFLKPGPVTPLAYKVQDETEVQVQFYEPAEASGILLNRPNPFRDKTMITFQSQREDEANLHIIDLNGRIVHSRKLVVDKGWNEWIIHRSDLPAPGMYIYEIKSKHQFNTNRMIIVD